MSSVAVVFSLEVLMDRHAWGRVPCHPLPASSQIPAQSLRSSREPGGDSQGSSAPLGHVHPTHLGLLVAEAATLLVAAGGGFWSWAQAQGRDMEGPAPTRMLPHWKEGYYPRKMVSIQTTAPRGVQPNQPHPDGIPGFQPRVPAHP